MTDIPMPLHAACPAATPHYNAKDGFCYGDPSGGGVGPTCDAGYVYSADTSACLTLAEMMALKGWSKTLPAHASCPGSKAYSSSDGNAPACYTVTAESGAVIWTDGAPPVCSAGYLWDGPKNACVEVPPEPAAEPEKSHTAYWILGMVGAGLAGAALMHLSMRDAK